MLVNHLKQEHFSLRLFKSEFALARSMYQCTFDSAVTNFMSGSCNTFAGLSPAL